MFRRVMRKISRRNSDDAAVIRLQSKRGSRISCNKRASCAYDSLALEDCLYVKPRPPRQFSAGAFDGYDHLHSVRGFSGNASAVIPFCPSTLVGASAVADALREYEDIADVGSQGPTASHSYELVSGPVGWTSSCARDAYAKVNKNRSRSASSIGGTRDVGVAGNKKRAISDRQGRDRGCPSACQHIAKETASRPFELRNFNNGSSRSEGISRKLSSTDVKKMERRPSVTKKSLRKSRSDPLASMKATNDAAGTRPRKVRFSDEVAEHETYTAMEYERCMQLNGHANFDEYLMEQEDAMQDEMEAEVRARAPIVRQRTANLRPSETRLEVEGLTKCCAEGQMLSQDVVIKEILGDSKFCTNSGNKIEKGDRIVQINDIWTLNVEHARWLLKRFSGDQTISITIIRQHSTVAANFLSLTRQGSLPASHTCAPTISRTTASFVACGANALSGSQRTTSVAIRV